MLREHHGEAQAPRRMHAIDCGVEDAPAFDGSGRAGGLDGERCLVDVNPVVVELPAPDDTKPLVLRLTISGNVHQRIIWLDQPLERVDARRNHCRVIGVQGFDDRRGVGKLRRSSHDYLYL